MMRQVFALLMISEFCLGFLSIGSVSASDLAPGDIVSFSDIHGDAKTLLSVLEQIGIIRSDFSLATPGIELVINGDVVDRGPNSFEMFEVLKRLKALAGLNVRYSLGNHDDMLLRGDFRYLHEDDFEKFAAFSPPNVDYLRIAESFNLSLPRSVGKRFGGKALAGFGALLLNEQSGVADYYRHVRVANVVRRHLFIHAGFDATTSDPNNLEEEFQTFLKVVKANFASAFFADFAGFQEMEPGRFRYATDDGPIWDRALGDMTTPTPSLRRYVKSMQRLWNVDTVVIGHTPTPSEDIELHFGGELIRQDTGFSSGYKFGMPHALIAGKAISRVQSFPYQDLTPQLAAFVDNVFPSMRAPCHLVSQKIIEAAYASAN